MMLPLLSSIFTAASKYNDDDYVDVRSGGEDYIWYDAHACLIPTISLLLST
jgi:hypothetical protein